MKKQLTLTALEGGPPKLKKLTLKPWKPKESTFQAALFDWAKHAEGQYPELAFMFMVPNGAVLGGHNRFAQVNHLKAQGLKRGVPDVVLPAMRCQHTKSSLERWYAGLYAELKTDNGVVSPIQHVWQEYLAAAGYMVGVYRELEDAILLLKSYLDMQQAPWVSPASQLKLLRDKLNDAVRAEEQAAQMRKNKRRLLNGYVR